MKIRNLVIVFLFTLGVADIQANENPFDETFEGMFEMEPIQIELPTSDGPPPPVPLDGGLVALLVAGGVAGYKKYKRSAP
jgi:hypothetical protein